MTDLHHTLSRIDATLESVRTAPMPFGVCVYPDWPVPPRRTPVGRPPVRGELDALDGDQFAVRPSPQQADLVVDWPTMYARHVDRQRAALVTRASAGKPDLADLAPTPVRPAGWLARLLGRDGAR